MARCVQAVLAAVAALAIARGALAGPVDLPDGLKVCKKSDPDLSNCIKNAVTDAFPVVANGFPTLSIGPIDPLRIKQLVVGQGSGPVSINLEFNDVDLIGLRNAWIDKFDVNLDNFSMHAKAKFNGPLTLAGPYKVTGTILLLPITGDGIANISLNDVVADVLVKGEHFKKGDDQFIKITTFDLKLVIQKLSIHLTNLFNGDKALGDTMNKFLNENSQDIFREIQPPIETGIGAALNQITTRFFSKVPFEQIFPSN